MGTQACGVQAQPASFAGAGGHSVQRFHGKWPQLQKEGRLVQRASPVDGCWAHVGAPLLLKAAAHQQQ